MAANVGMITCPQCGKRSEHPVPDDACVVVVDCPNCAARITPKAGDCCVFCSYGDAQCPPRLDELRTGSPPNII